MGSQASAARNIRTILNKTRKRVNAGTKTIHRSIVPASVSASQEHAAKELQKMLSHVKSHSLFKSSPPKVPSHGGKKKKTHRRSRK